MNRGILILFFLSMGTAGAGLSAEHAAGKRLHEILGTTSVQKDRPNGRRLTLIDVPDSSRERVHREQLQLFVRLQRLGTREAARVLAEYLDDERYILVSEGDIINLTIADYAESALATIRREHPKSVPGAPPPLRAPDPFNSKAWRAWSESYDRLRIDGWRKWWAANKAAYEQESSATPIPK